MALFSYDAPQTVRLRSLIGHFGLTFAGGDGDARSHKAVAPCLVTHCVSSLPSIYQPALVDAIGGSVFGMPERSDEQIQAALTEWLRTRRFFVERHSARCFDAVELVADTTQKQGRDVRRARSRPKSRGA